MLSEIIKRFCSRLLFASVWLLRGLTSQKSNLVQRETQKSSGEFLVKLLPDFSCNVGAYCNETCLRKIIRNYYCHLGLGPFYCHKRIFRELDHSFLLVPFPLAGRSSEDGKRGKKKTIICHNVDTLLSHG